MEEEAKYEVGQKTIDNILNRIKEGLIVVPEIQRPFVWENSKVRDLIDSIYRGFPVGYFVFWSGEGVKLKSGESSLNKTIVIDGQQRITALHAALLGEKVLNKNFQEKSVSIAFNPQAGGGRGVFEVTSAAIRKDPAWIDDISVLFKDGTRLLDFLNSYMEENPDADQSLVYDNLEKLKKIKIRNIGVIELNNSLDIDEVTEIFVRINSKGSKLTEADFAMSKIASSDEYEGSVLRKAIDYFSHMIAEPRTMNFERLAEKDPQLKSSQFYHPLKERGISEKPTVYKPTCDDIIRVAFMSREPRGKLSNLVSLLSGRNFQKRTYEAEIKERSFKNLKEGILDFMNPYNFDQFNLCLMSAGFKTDKLLNSRMTLDFCYTLYLRLLKSGEIPKSDIKRYVQKWFIASTLTERYSSSSETAMDRDIRNLESRGIVKMLEDLEESSLSDTFWNTGLVQKLETTSVKSPFFNVYRASLIFMKSRSLFSGITNEDILLQSGDLHHIFPREYLKEKGFGKQAYNQIANLTPVDKPINTAIGKKAPNEYFHLVLDGCENGEGSVITGLCNKDDYYESLKDNAIPKEVIGMDIADYDRFLDLRRRKMAKQIKDYYAI